MLFGLGVALCGHLGTQENGEQMIHDLQVHTLSQLESVPAGERNLAFLSPPKMFMLSF
jgi:hypothetical protein